MTLEERLATIMAGELLDVATGSGQFIGVLTRMLGGYDRIVGIDLSGKALEQAGKQAANANISFQQMDCQNMTFPDDSFDTVTLSNSLHHFVDPEPALVEMRRVCRPGGTIVLSEMVCDGQSAAQMTHVLLHHWWAAIDTLTGIVHRETYSRSQIRALVEPLGFAEIEFFEWLEDDSDPRDPERLLQFHGIADDYSAKIPAGEETELLRAQGRVLHERLDTIGILGATTFAVIGRN